MADLRLLLDKHALIWWLGGDETLSIYEYGLGRK